MIKIKEIVNSILSSKSYILYHNKDNMAWLIDIGDIEPIKNFLQEKNLVVKGVFLTHGHYDHIYGLQSLVMCFPDCKVYATSYTKLSLASEELNLSIKSDKPIRFEGCNVVEVKEGDVFALFGKEPALQIYETPGHNPGCITMIIGDYIFTGDAYIPGLGVKDLVLYANKEQAKLSMERILRMAQGKKIFPGHQIEK